jgi:hypothetical protein
MDKFKISLCGWLKLQIDHYSIKIKNKKNYTKVSR